MKEVCAGEYVQCWDRHPHHLAGPCLVQVKMSDECHKALKQYAAFLGIPMGELFYSACYDFHEQAHYVMDGWHA